MRALITGINGFVGSHLAEHLLGLGGWQVYGQSREGELKLAALEGQVGLLQADLADREAVRGMLAAARPEVIFHLAGQPFVPESFRDPTGTLAANTLGALHLCLALIDLQQPARLMVVGTNEVYGQISPEDLPINEGAPLRPANPYGVSKAAQDLLALQYHLSHGLDIVRLRPFTHIGPRQSGRFVSAAFARQVALIEAGRQPPVIEVGNLSPRRDFTDVRDIVRGYTLAALHGAAGAVYNLGSGAPVAVSALLEQLIGLAGLDVEVRPVAELMRPIDIPLVACDAARLRACAGWAPQIPLAQTLSDILDDWRGRVRAGTA